MQIITSNPDHAGGTYRAKYALIPIDNITPLSLRDYCRDVFGNQRLYTAAGTITGPWQYLLLCERSEISQYDTIVDYAARGESLPHGLLCQTGSGRILHGQHGRVWSALDGNIHLSVWLTPRITLERFGVAFQALSAVAVVEAIDTIPGLTGKAGIKWVNDIYLGGAKVAGFLTHTQSVDTTVMGVLLGIGVNVEATPLLEDKQDHPRVTSLHDHIASDSIATLARVFDSLLSSLATNYQRIVDGRVEEILDAYRQRSIIIGRRVRFVDDGAEGEIPSILAEGKVTHLGRNLEVYLDSVIGPQTRGRLIMLDDLE